MNGRWWSRCTVGGCDRRGYWRELHRAAVLLFSLSHRHTPLDPDNRTENADVVHTGTQWHGGATRLLTQPSGEVLLSAALREHLESDTRPDVRVNSGGAVVIGHLPAQRHR